MRIARRSVAAPPLLANGGRVLSGQRPRDDRRGEDGEKSGERGETSHATLGQAVDGA